MGGLVRREAQRVLFTFTAALCLAVVACADTDRAGDSAADEAVPVGEAIEKVTEEGPVKATVSVAPKEPRLGDRIVLTLTVEAAAGVVVEMPVFGEALGRFEIVDYVPRERAGSEGGTVHVQRYTLQPPMSGRQRIPPLRLEYLDERPGQGDSGDAGAGGARELLTEEVTVFVEPVNPDGTIAAELRPAREELPEHVGTALWVRLWPLYVVLGVLAAGGVVLLVWMRGRAERARISAYEVAVGRLAALEARGLPSAEDAGDWYVELSGIVRRYLEDRFALRAPELTTEEFLREASHSRHLTDEHRDLLGSFLVLCDRVKFAGHRPEDAESEEALAAARRFLHDTRPPEIEGREAA